MAVGPMRRRLYNNLLNALIPLSVLRQSQALGWDAEWLADVEKDHDSWAPDELWAAQQRHPASGSVHSPRTEHTRTTGGTHRAQSPLRLVPAADREDPPVSATTVGGPFTSDELLIEELVRDYREFLRERAVRGLFPFNR